MESTIIAFACTWDDLSETILTSEYQRRSTFGQMSGP